MLGLIARLERRLAVMQGKGFGAFSIAEEIAAVARFLPIEGTALCIDVGANVGHYTAGLLERFPNTRVVAFEPAATNIARLSGRFADEPRVTLVPKAIAEEAGSAILHADKAGSGLGSLTHRQLDHHGITFDHAETVETIGFERFWQEELGGRPIDFMKIDVEGHELSVLRGAGSAIEHIAVVQFEFGGCNIDTRTYFRDFWQFFEPRGFELYRIAPRGPLPIHRYAESEESFDTTNFLAVRRQDGASTT